MTAGGLVPGSVHPMTTYHWLSLVTSAGQLMLAILVLLRGWRSPLALVLGLLAINLFSWNAADLAADFSSLEAWNWVDHGSSAMTMPLVFHFVILFTGRARQLRPVIVLSYVGFGAIMLPDLVAFAVPSLRGFGGSSSWAMCLLAGVVPEIAAAIVLLANHLRNTASPLERARTWLVLLAMLVGFALGSTDLLRLVGLMVPRLANIGTLASTVLLAIVALRLRMFEDEVPSLHAIAAAVLAGLSIVTYLAIFHAFADKRSILVLGTITATGAIFIVVRQLVSAAADHRSRRDYVATIGRFSAQMAHDLKNPIATMKGALQFLEEERARGRSLVEHQDYVDLLLEQVERMNDVVDRYQRLARVEAKPEPLSINELVRAVLALRRLRASPKITIEEDLDESLPECFADRDLLAGAFENLVANAIEAIPEKGTVTVRTRCVRNIAKGSIMISVEDSGQGMDPRVRERAFDDFFTTKTTGSGLGLSFARRVAEAHGGDISLKSEDARGTTVTLQLPLT